MSEIARDLESNMAPFEFGEHLKCDVLPNDWADEIRKRDELLLQPLRAQVEALTRERDEALFNDDLRMRMLNGAKRRADNAEKVLEETRAERRALAQRDEQQEADIKLIHGTAEMLSRENAALHERYRQEILSQAAQIERLREALDKSLAASCLGCARGDDRHWHICTEIRAALQPAAAAGATVGVEPVPIERLECPGCKLWHVDEGEWATRPHKTHLCVGCGMEWRPFEYPTVGVNPQPQQPTEPDARERRDLCASCGHHPVAHLGTGAERACKQNANTYPCPCKGYRQVDGTAPEPPGGGEVAAFLASPENQRALDIMEQFRCPDCGFLTDTPNHELGCKPAASPPAGSGE